ncbi:hypothetical protein DSUL_160089 [Desulfovibrionales bacterium]
MRHQDDAYVTVSIICNSSLGNRFDRERSELMLTSRNFGLYILVPHAFPHAHRYRPCPAVTESYRTMRDTFL